MKAVQIYEHGGADKLRYEDADDPVLRSPRDVIVRLRAASLNHIDLWNRKGLTGMKVEFPHILGADGAGVVEEVGSEVTHLTKGDAVCLYPPVGCGGCEFCRTSREYMCVRLRVLGEGMKGSYAEYVAIPGANCFPNPRGLRVRGGGGVSAGVHHGLAHAGDQRPARARREGADPGHRRRRGPGGAADRQGHEHLGGRDLEQRREAGERPASSERTTA